MIRIVRNPRGSRTPAARFVAEELHYLIIAVTQVLPRHQRAPAATLCAKNPWSNALTIVDERPDEAPSLDLMLSEAEAVREALIPQYPDTKEHVDALLRFMEQYSYAPANKLYRPGVELDPNKVNEELGWFRTGAAERLSKSASRIPGLDKVFAFAKALAVGRACVATSGALTNFFGYGATCNRQSTGQSC
jgi:hypothetical protein